MKPIIPKSIARFGWQITLVATLVCLDALAMPMILPMQGNLMNGSSGPTGTAHYVFVNTTDYSGNLLPTAATDCQTQGDASAISGKTWAVFHSTTTQDAKDLVTLDGEIRLVNGTVIANDKADMFDGTLDHAINLDNLGADASGNEIFTGTKADGTLSDVGNCTDWTDGSGFGFTHAGSSDAVNGWWAEAMLMTMCNLVAKVYCISTD